MAQAISEAEDLLTCAQPAEHLESATPEEWYEQRAAWYAHNTFNQPPASKANEQLPQPDALLGLSWWNNLTEVERIAWMERAGNTGVAADAWAAFKAAGNGSEQA
jgi:hypothetical protein